MVCCCSARWSGFRGSSATSQSVSLIIDYRNPDRIEHTVEELITLLVHALALDYEDLNARADLRNDPLLAALVGRHDLLGQERFRRRDRGKALAGKSTLNRLELTPARAYAKARQNKIAVNRRAVQHLFTDIFLQAYRRPPERIVLDMDATDDPIHGHQSGRFFHSYYKNYC
ncbi:MAG: transposase [Phycisphaerae bacterium]